MEDSAGAAVCFFIYLLLLVLEIFLTAFHTSSDEITDAQYDELTSRHPGLFKIRTHFEAKGFLSEHVYLTVTALFLTAEAILSYHTFLFAFSGRMPAAQESLTILCVYLACVVFLGVSVFTPFYINTHRPSFGMLPSAFVYRFLEILFLPTIWLCRGIAYPLAALFGVNAAKAIADVTEDELKSMVQEGHEQGVLLASEAEMIRNVFEFDEKDAKDIMIHRKDIIAMDGELTLEEAVSVFWEHHYSRFPVYLEDLDNIIGILHMRELFSFYSDEQNRSAKLRDLDGLLGTAVFVPETHGINTLFAQMQNRKTHMVIVTDEYGQTGGLISMEDILEEIVGNIQDEHDEEQKPIVKKSNDTWITEGRTPLSDIEEELGTAFSAGDIETLNGYLISKIDRIPKDHVAFDVEADGYHFHVQDVDGKMIQRVIITKIHS